MNNKFSKIQKIKLHKNKNKVFITKIINRNQINNNKQINCQTKILNYKKNNKNNYIKENLKH